MADMKFSVVPVESSDLPTLIQFLLASKLHLTINRLLFKDWPNEDSQLANCTRAMERGFANPSSEMFKALDNESGEILAHLVLARKKPEKTAATTTEGDKKKDEIPKGMNPEVFWAVINAVGEIQPNQDEEHYELTHIFVKQSRRSQGIGTRLVQLCIEKAKADGIPLFVSSEPQAHQFFLARGFDDTRHVDIADLSKWAPPYCGFGVFRLFGMVMRN